MAKSEKSTVVQGDRVKKVFGPGVAVYPHLNTPDTKFATEGDPGVYKINLRVSGDSGRKMIEWLDACFVEWKEQFCKKLKRRQLRDSSPQWSPSVDSDGNEIEDSWDIKFKMPAGVIKNGKRIDLTPGLIDAKKNPIDADKVMIGGGSVVKVAAQIWPWHSPAQGFGVKMNLRAVQVIDLKTFGGDYSDAFDEEDGFEYAGGSEGDEFSGDDDFSSEAGDGGEAEDF